MPQRKSPRITGRRLLLPLAFLAVSLTALGLLRYQDAREWWIARKPTPALKRAAASAPADALIQVTYGERLTAEGRYADALQAYVAADRALAEADRSPLAARVRARLGYTLAQAGHIIAAAPLLDQARSITPGDPWIYMGNALVFLHQSQLDSALKQAEAAASLAPNNPEAHYLLGKIHNDNKTPEAAVASLRKAVALRPDSAAFQAELGNAYAFASNFTEAVSYFRRAVKLALTTGCLAALA